MSVQTVSGVKATEPNEHGYRSFSLGEFTFRRDEYFVYVKWPTGRHVLSADGFLRALQRDVAWEFFYGTVNFDGVVGTVPVRQPSRDGHGVRAEGRQQPGGRHAAAGRRETDGGRAGRRGASVRRDRPSDQSPLRRRAAG